MGSTCACAWIIGNRLYTVTVGDSRIYLQRGEAIYQLTTDHTWIQEMVDRCQISPDQAHNHPNAHVIRRYLGSPIPPEGDFRLRIGPGDRDELALANQGFILHPGDKLLLCTDGLTDLVKDSEIRSTLNRNLPGKPTSPHHQASNPNQKLGVALQELVDLANKRGGHDNITVIVMQVPPTPAIAAKPMVKTTFWYQKKWQVVMVTLVIMGLFGGEAFLGVRVTRWLQGYYRSNAGMQTTTGSLKGQVSSSIPTTGTPSPMVKTTLTTLVKTTL
jgi:serine/threonine protein phosphatase PrpC